MITFNLVFRFLFPFYILVDVVSFGFYAVVFFRSQWTELFFFKYFLLISIWQLLCCYLSQVSSNLSISSQFKLSISSQFKFIYLKSVQIYRSKVSSNLSIYPKPIQIHLSQFSSNLSIYLSVKIYAYFLRLLGLKVLKSKFASIYINLK